MTNSPTERVLWMAPANAMAKPIIVPDSAMGGGGVVLAHHEVEFAMRRQPQIDRAEGDEEDDGAAEIAEERQGAADKIPPCSPPFLTPQASEIPAFAEAIAARAVASADSRDKRQAWPQRQKSGGRADDASSAICAAAGRSGRGTNRRTSPPPRRAPSA